MFTCHILFRPPTAEDAGTVGAFPASKQHICFFSNRMHGSVVTCLQPANLCCADTHNSKQQSKRV
jgi:hypothetical protein